MYRVYWLGERDSDRALVVGSLLGNLLREGKVISIESSMIDPYFDNLEEIQNAWRSLKQSGFPQKERDEFWGLCLKGQELFWQYSNHLEREGFGLKGIGKVPAYERAIMLLEHEGRLAEAISMCKSANKWKLETDWYDKRIKKLEKKLKM